MTGSLAQVLSCHRGSANPLSHPLAKAYPVPLPQAGAVLDPAPSRCPSLNPENEHKWPTPLILGSGQTTGKLLFYLKGYIPSPWNHPSEIASINWNTCIEWLYLLTFK